MEDLLEKYPPLLSVTDAAEILRVTDRTVRNLIKSGDIKYIKVGRLFRIPKNKFVEYLENQN